MQFKFLFVALFFAVIVNAQQTNGGITGEAQSVLSSLTSNHSKTSSASGTSATSSNTSSASKTSSSMTSSSKSESSSSTSMSETTSGTETSSPTATSTSGAGNSMSYGLPTEMIALVALFMASFIVIVT